MISIYLEMMLPSLRSLVSFFPSNLVTTPEFRIRIDLFYLFRKRGQPLTWDIIFVMFSYFCG